MGVMLHYFNVGKIRSRQHMSHRSGGVVMIEVNHISKDFVSQKKYPGLKGAVKGLFSAEKTVKKQSMISHLQSRMARSSATSGAMEPGNRLR